MQEPLFPREVTARLPRITLTGGEMLHVEQHQGLVVCQDEEIALRTASGRLVVRGSGLRFGLYTQGEARILGQIHMVCLQPEGGSLCE